STEFATRAYDFAAPAASRAFNSQAREEPDSAPRLRRAPLYTGLLITVLDVLLIVHAASTGRFMPWGFVILFLPGVGGLVYVVFELAPEWFGSYGAQRARRSVAAALDPTGRYRALRDELDVVDTVANRSALAEESLKLGRPQEALGPRAARARSAASGPARPPRTGPLDRRGGRALAQARAAARAGERAGMVRPRQATDALGRLRPGFPWARKAASSSPKTDWTPAVSSKTAIVVSPDSVRELTFDVVLREPRGESRHRVTVSTDDAARFAKLGADPARAVEAAMAFLLDREPKDSILGAFDINVIRRYFPE